MNAYTTTKKVYAVGARVDEIPLKKPEPGAIELGIATLEKPVVRPPRKKVFRRLNHCAVPGYAPLCMDSNDAETVNCGFRQRLLRKVPESNQEKLKRLRVFVREYLKKNIAVVEPMNFEEWLASTSYNEARKKELRAVEEQLRGGKPGRKTCRKIAAFVKSEFYAVWKHCRLINSRCDAFKVWSGPRFKAIENELYRQHEFIKHVPVPERPALIDALRAGGRRYYQTDYTAYESHFKPEIMEIVECELYRHCLGNDVSAQFLCSVISGWNYMRTHTGIRAKIQGRRMSGDMCTSLGNGFTNLMLAKFIAEEHSGHLEGFVEGDDGLFATDFELKAEDYKDLGFTIKIGEVEDPCEASFCGMIFSRSGEIIRDPRTFMMGFGWTQSFISAGPKIMDELLRAKALSSAYETPQCPIIGAFSRYALAKTVNVLPRFVNDGYHIPRDVVNVPVFSPSADTRLLFERKYQVSVATQLAAEECIRNGRFECLQHIIPPESDCLQYSMNYVEVT